MRLLTACRSLVVFPLGLLIAVNIKTATLFAPTDDVSVEEHGNAKTTSSDISEVGFLSGSKQLHGNTSLEPDVEEPQEKNLDDVGPEALTTEPSLVPPVELVAGLEERRFPRMWCLVCGAQLSNSSEPVPLDQKHKRRTVMDMGDHSQHRDRHKQQKDPFIDQSMCVPMRKWQVRPRPNCNTVHEIDLRGGKFLGSGGWRSAWKIWGATSPYPAFSWNTHDEFVLKTTKSPRKSDWFGKVTQKRHFVDAAITGQLTASPHVVDTYGYCANAALNEVAEEKLTSALKVRGKSVSPIEMLDYATQVASGIADLHSIDDKNHASAVHKDLKPANIVVSKDGSLRLNDFNDAELLKWNTTSNATCAFRRRRWKANYRSAEELFSLPLSDRVDVYALGGIIYFILTGTHPYSGKSDSNAAKAIAQGVKPKLPSKVRDSDDPVIQFLIKTLDKCLTYKATRRPSSKTIADSLKRELDSRRPKKM